jgi:hypothetical protein
MLEFRSTSKPTDEPLAIAPLLGLDTAPLVECAASRQRMGLFWQQLGRVDGQIVGASSRKLSTPGLRRAPRQLMDRDEEQVWRVVPHDHLLATVTLEGLLGKSSMFVFEGTLQIDLSAPHSPIAFHDSEAGDVYGLSPGRDEGDADCSTPFYCDAIWVAERPSNPWQCVSLSVESRETGGKPAIYAYGNGIRIMAVDTRA